MLQGKTHILEIAEFSETDRGRYTAHCIGTEVMTSAIIDVAIPATVEVIDDNVTIKADVFTEISVDIKGMPRPEVIWSKVC